MIPADFPESFVARHFPPKTLITSLKGDASTRRFFRIAAPSEPSRILMVYSEAFIWKHSSLRGNHEYLERLGVPVPRIQEVFENEGAVLLEDLGDTTLQGALLKDPSIDRWPLYREAIDIIILLQERGTRELPPNATARQSALDEEKFLWELDHFFRHFVRGFRRAHPDADEEAGLRSFFQWLAASLGSTRRVLCHRDFQSRNLMVTPGGLRVVDYQDARMGPPSYDLASLLRDSSLDLDEDLREKGIRYFLSRRKDLTPEEFREEFGRMALQRNIKDLGTFGYQSHHAGKVGYEEYIPRTLRMVRSAMLTSQRYHSIFPLFEKLVFNPPGG
jgi:aminoglycoside/choline kinase family phosphotransferase